MTKIRLKGRLQNPIVGQFARNATIKFTSTITRENDLMRGASSEFVTDETGNYDFEIHLGEYAVETSDVYGPPVARGIVRVGQLAAGLQFISLTELVGYQEVPTLDAVTEAFRIQKQELSVLEQSARQSATAAEAAEDEAQRIADAMGVATQEFPISFRSGFSTDTGNLTIKITTFLQAANNIWQGLFVELSVSIINENLTARANAKYVLDYAGHVTWGEPVVSKIFGSDITITHVSATNQEITFSITGAKQITCDVLAMQRGGVKVEKVTA